MRLSVQGTSAPAAVPTSDRLGARNGSTVTPLLRRASARRTATRTATRPQAAVSCALLFFCLAARYWRRVHAALLDVLLQRTCVELPKQAGLCRRCLCRCRRALPPCLPPASHTPAPAPPRRLRPLCAAQSSSTSVREMSAQMRDMRRYACSSLRGLEKPSPAASLGRGIPSAAPAHCLSPCRPPHTPHPPPLLLSSAAAAWRRTSVWAC